MIWENLGIICNPKDLPFGDGIYCQSPHAIQLEGFVRVYFTTRIRDGEKNYKSYPAFIDYTNDFNEILGYSNFPILPLGPLGNFDEHGIFPFQPFVTNTGQIMATTTGWSRRQSVATDSAIGLSISNDNGRTFNRIGSGPILAALHHEPFLVADGYVLENEGTYHLFYIAGRKWIEEDGETERIYKIRHAKSSNLVDWERSNLDLIADSIGENECQALPSVLKVKDGWLMAFCFRDTFDFRFNRERSYRIGWAKSQDLVTWNRVDLDYSIGNHISQWDNDMQAYPNLFKNEFGTYLLYNGNNFGAEGFGIGKLMEET